MSSKARFEYFILGLAYESKRTAAAVAMVDWIDAADMPNTVITGDLSAYDQEAPISALKDGGEEAYSYVFDGQLARQPRLRTRQLRAVVLRHRCSLLARQLG